MRHERERERHRLPGRIRSELGDVRGRGRLELHVDGDQRLSPARRPVLHQRRDVVDHRFGAGRLAPPGDAELHRDDASEA